MAWDSPSGVPWTWILDVSHIDLVGVSDDKWRCSLFLFWCQSTWHLDASMGNHVRPSGELISGECGGGDDFQPLQVSFDLQVTSVEPTIYIFF